MSITLADGGTIPRIGLGTWPMDDVEAERVVAEALDLGYRLVDTAYAYGNETGVGRGLRASGVDRDEVFVTTKFNAISHSVTGVAEAWADSARRLGVEVVDLMLIHWPNPWRDRYVEAWAGLVDLQARGKVRHIGVSNFLPEHLDRIIAATGVTPVLDQLQINPRYLQSAARVQRRTRDPHAVLVPPRAGHGPARAPGPRRTGAGVRVHPRAGRPRLAPRPRPEHGAEVGPTRPPRREPRGR